MLEKAKKLIDDYCWKEYGSGADFSDLHRIGVAYTTIGDDEEHEIQAYIDLVDFKLIQCIDGRVIEEYVYDSIEKLIEVELENLDFDVLTCSENGLPFLVTIEEVRRNTVVVWARDAEEARDGAVDLVYDGKVVLYNDCDFETTVKMIDAKETQLYTEYSVGGYRWPTK